jgi:hypothetical protein
MNDMDAINGALTIAEGDVQYKTDVSLAFGGSRIEKRFVLRTSLDSLSVWKAKYVTTNMSPFDAKLKTIVKEAAIIDKEVWVFGIDSTKPTDIVAAIEIAKRWYKVGADKLISDVYVKNLNAEQENPMGEQALVNANKELYSGVCAALVEAARLLGVKDTLNLWVISANVNPKIPAADLHDALRQGGAKSVETDPYPHKYISGSNDGQLRRSFKTNLHLAKLSIK